MSAHHTKIRTCTDYLGRHMRYKGTVAALVLVLLTSARPTPAQAASGQAQVFHAKQLMAQAIFQPIDPAGCATTFVFVQAGTDVIHAAPGPATESTLVSALVQQFNQCTGVTINAFGATSSPDRLQIDPNLTSATVAATITVFDAATATSFDVKANISWTASGQNAHTVTNTDIQGQQGTVIHEHMNGMVYPAQASASVIMGSGAGTINFTPDPASSAEIESQKSSNITIAPV